MIMAMRLFRRTTLIAVFCLAILAGLGLSRKLSLEFPAWIIFGLPLLLPVLRRKGVMALYLVIILGLGLGLWRGSLFMGKLDDLKSLTARKVTIQATAASDSIYAKGSQLEFTANRVELLEPRHQSLAGRFKLSGFGVPMVYRGDRLEIQGKLYPTRGSNQARIAYAKLSLIGADGSLINKLTRHFTAGMQNALPEPEASFASGLLIGQRNNLSLELTNQLIAVGLVHIVAVSGYNLTILVRAAGRLRLGSKYQQLLLSLALIAGFVLVTGFSASIVRAAMVSLLSLWAWYYGRRIRPIVLITFAAALTGLLNPFYVWGDLGWYLSFLAFFGVLQIAPVLAARLFNRPPKLLTMVVLETLSAELMTLPLIALTFGQLSLVALLANALIVPLVPLAMLLSAVAAGAGALIPQLAGWIAWPAKLLLTYMLDLVRLLAGIPSALVHITINPIWMVVLYGSVMLMILAARHHLKDKQQIPDKKVA